MSSSTVEGPGSHGARLGLLVEAREGHEGPRDASNGGMGSQPSSTASSLTWPEPIIGKQKDG